MEQTIRTADWIGSYLEWIDASWAAPSAPATQAEAETDFCAAYLDWIEADLTAGTERRDVSRQMYGRRTSDTVAGTSGFREAVLLAALHAESDCLHIMRRLVENSGVEAETLRLALKALDHAKQLIDDERMAKQALDELRGVGERRAGDILHARIDAEWPRAIEHVVADVRSLTDTVIAMQLH